MRMCKYMAKDFKFFLQHYPVFLYPGRQSFLIEEWLVLGLGNLGKPLT